MPCSIRGAPRKSEQAERKPELARVEVRFITAVVLLIGFVAIGTRGGAHAEIMLHFSISGPLPRAVLPRACAREAPPLARQR